MKYKYQEKPSHINSRSILTLYMKGHAFGLVVEMSKAHFSRPEFCAWLDSSLSLPVTTDPGGSR